MAAGVDGLTGQVDGLTEEVREMRSELRQTVPFEIAWLVWHRLDLAAVGATITSAFVLLKRTSTVCLWCVVLRLKKRANLTRTQFAG